MVRSLNSGVSGIQQFQGKLDVIGNNIANSTTLGYKTARADFEDAFSQTLQSPSGGAAGVQIGSGVSTGAIRSSFNQGTITRTGLDSDMAIDGDGFFVVRDPVNQQEFVTRAGDFRVDNTGHLVTNGGLRLQGLTNGALGDIKLESPPTAASGVKVVGFLVSDTGMIKARLSDGNQAESGQIVLQRFQDPNALIKEGNNLFSGMQNAGALGGATPVAQAAGSNGLGRIRAGSLEMSNVDLASEFASLIVTQRGFQASARIITTTDEMLQEVVNLKR